MNTVTKIMIVGLGIASVDIVHADLKRDPMSLITGDNVIANTATTKTVTAGLGNKSIQTGENTMRCWQEGVMIVAEHDWKLSGAKTSILENSDNQKIYTFDYSETFCMYIGR